MGRASISERTYHHRGFTDGAVFYTFPRPVLGCIDTDFDAKRSLFSRSTRLSLHHFRFCERQGRLLFSYKCQRDFVKFQESKEVDLLKFVKCCSYLLNFSQLQRFYKSDITDDACFHIF